MNTFDDDISPSHARSWDAPQWASWLVTAFSTNRVAPFRFHPEASLIDEIDRLFIAADEYSRRRMREGVVQAVREWHADFHGGDYGILRLLSRTSARLRAFEVIPLLIAFLKANYRAMASGREPFFTVVDDLISVLAGFAPDSRVEDFFDLLLFDDDVTPKLAALLAVGLCRCNPARFVDCFERFWARRSVLDTYFIDRAIIARFEKAVTPPEVIRRISDMSLAVQKYYLGNMADARRIGAKDLVGFDTPDPADDRGQPLGFNQSPDAYRQAEMRYGLAVQASSDISPAGKRLKKDDVETSPTDLILSGMAVHAAEYAPAGAP